MSTNKYTSETGRSSVPDVALVTIGTLLLGIIILVLVQTTRPAASSEIVVLEATPLAPSDDLTVITEGDVTVYVPPNAIDTEGSIAIAPAEPNQLVANDPDWIRTKVVNIEFNDAEGVTFPEVSLVRPLEVCFTLTEKQWQDFNTRPGFYQVQYYAEQKSQPRWENLPRVTYPDRLFLCGQTYHLSLFSLAILVEPEIPVTGPTVTFTATVTSTAISPAQPVQTHERRNPRDTAVPTNPPPTKAPPTATQPPPTNPPSTNPPPTNPPPTVSPPTNPPPTNPPPTNPPPTDPPPTDPPPAPTEPEPTEPESTQPAASDGDKDNNGNGPPPGQGPPGGPPGQNKP